MNISRFTYFVSNNPSGTASPRKIDLLRLTPSPSNIRRAPRKREKIAPRKGIQNSLGFWIPRRGFRIQGTGFQIFFSGI